VIKSRRRLKGLKKGGMSEQKVASAKNRERRACERGIGKTIVECGWDNRALQHRVAIPVHWEIF